MHDGTPAHVVRTAALRPRSVRLVLDVSACGDRWILSYENAPESVPHRETVDLLRWVLLAFVAREHKTAYVAANLGCHWDPDHPGVGVDPDIALLDPAPPGAGRLPCLRTWEPGHAPPRFAVEVVSPSNPHKDYVAAPAKYALLGTRELIIFDPSLQGPAAMDGPYVLQVWHREDGIPTMTRVYAGDGPARSAELDAWLVPTAHHRLRIADDEHGRSPWPTEAEAEAAARQQEAAPGAKEPTARQMEATARQQAEEGMRRVIEDVCELRGIALDDARRTHLATLDAAGLEQLRVHLKHHRTWPG